MDVDMDMDMDDPSAVKEARTDTAVPMSVQETRDQVMDAM
jgi:hypothetical protein